ncbi:MAG: hypothetical protein H6830_11060 [Planctomycetes bacterium]|nr:hypothetical protein [Planctomycetota bacterium]HRV82439.1 hypothetical protein [Planctomycetota bacterium]
MAEQPQAPRQPQLVLHEGLKFSSQTIHLAGNAFKHCQFERCTLVMTNTPAHFEGCQFSGCNWRLEFDLLHGDPGTLQTLRNLLQLVAGASGQAAPTPPTA